MGSFNLKALITMLFLIGAMTNAFAQESDIIVEDDAPVIEESESDEAPVMDDSSDYSEEEY